MAATTKELLEEERKFRLDTSATRLTRLIINEMVPHSDTKPPKPFTATLQQKLKSLD
ncbi:hypothetical protein KIN20_008190 [Parelaphostrongylus tenuis]|uniref:Uncharacterized protein n=1 Tax=Parelaphostrongylus tenuis TaxID=148309 RepID=A0AAD5QIM9_PARTN|nr:hypothetical protein KIN20_008190 [Parelaphostrongylus tenuis]